ncbi:MAG: hypothetical protein KA236_10130 [Verrucomicrobia bacterium]|jgi:hypothetical protein|nr:hypothetical protein [Verrucomicrobiota bacterium]
MLGEPQPISAVTTTATSVGVLDHVLANLGNIFDRRQLVAVPRGVSPDAATAPLLTESNSPEYLRRLATSSIAVSLGGHPGLTAIQFKDRPGLDAFLARNPACAESLVTAHDGALIIWIRAVTAHRAPLDLPQLHVQMAGKIMVFDRQALQSRDEFLNLAGIQTVDLYSLDWGQDADGPVAAWLTTLTHGQFVRRTPRGRIVPKRDAWLDFLRRRLKATTAFDRATGRFWQRPNGDTWQPRDAQQLTGEIRQLVISAPIPGVLAHTWCDDEWLAGMLRCLRRVLVSEVPFAVDLLRTFVREALILAPGQDVTVAELNAAFLRYCRERTLPLIAQGVFQKLIPKVLSESPWGRAKSKSVRRESGAQNGFRGIALRSSFWGRAP